MSGELIVNIPTYNFWAEMESLETGTGLGVDQVKFTERNLGYDAGSISFCKAPENWPDADLWPSSIEGKNFRYNLLAFALTIPKDMIP